MNNRPIHKILIANRGEIALRIINAVHALGKKAVVVHSRHDSELQFVKLADEALLLEGESLSETYLKIDQIIKLAKESNADAIHPGYGFLSENSEFASSCEQENIIFIGPDAKAIDLMGNKSRAREIAQDAGLTVLNGAKGSISEILKASKELNFPVIIKPAAGGGGKGMQILHDRDRLEQVLEETVQISRNIFGSTELYVEEYLPDPRHLEVQVLADHHGNMIHLFDRECSLQRRFQKIIEEAPSKSISEDTRKIITAKALDLARNISYRNAGTVEFLMDSNEKFYFIEMNTRIQVEHPVTEMITGIDIVQEQIRIAENKELAIKQEDIAIHGHSIEARLYAEDPDKNFSPSGGNLRIFDMSRVKDRIDHGYVSGDEVTTFYDPTIAKVISTGKRRQEAIGSLITSISSLHITGLTTNKSFLISILESSDFLENNIHTHYVEQTADLRVESQDNISDRVLAILSAISLNHTYESSFENTIWNEIGHLRNGSELLFEIKNNQFKVRVRENRSRQEFYLDINGKQFTVSIRDQGNNLFTFKLGNEIIECWAEVHGSVITLDIGTETYRAQRMDIPDSNIPYHDMKDQAIADDDRIVAPINGKVVKINAATSQVVKKGDTVLVIESMKMENHIMSPREAIIEAVNVTINELVKSNEVLIKFRN